MPKLRRAAPLLAILALFGGAAWPQGETTSAISGQITDQSGAPIPGADVSISNAGTGMKRSVETGDDGRFHFPQLTPGTYAVEASAAGFEPRRIDGVAAA